MEEGLDNSLALKEIKDNVTEFDGVVADEFLWVVVALWINGINGHGQSRHEGRVLRMPSPR